MKRLVISALVLASISGGWPASADSPLLKEKRANSCGSTAFEGVAGGYRNLNHKLVGRTQVGDALLEWCQDARNAVIYFYVDDPTAPLHKQCPENMSVAIFPGRGAEVEQILRDNEPSYYAPNVTLIEEPRTESAKFERGGRVIDGWRLQAVLIDSGGYKRRQTMIGYQKDGAFVRIMTGLVEDPACANAVARSFMTKLDWP